MNRIINSACFLLLSLLSFGQHTDYDRTIKPYIIAEFSPLENEVDTDERRKIQMAHMQYINSLAEHKKLVMAGPFAEGGGLFFLNTSEESTAKEWIENDPTIKNKINSYTLRKWFTEKGLFTLDNNSAAQNFGVINPAAPKETLQYGQLVGEWDCEIANLNPEGEWINEKATWTFVYILDGFAIQDFWTKATTGIDYLGTNIRIFHPKTNKWKCTWLENGENDMNGVWISYQNEQGELILHDETETWQILFYNISADSFDWKWDFKQEDGSMETRVKIKAKRVVQP